MDDTYVEFDALCLASDEAGMEIGQALLGRCENASLLHVRHPREALKLTIRLRPKLFFISLTTGALDSATNLITELSRRRFGNDVQIVGVSQTYDELIERTARVAGATHYLTLTSAADDVLLDSIIANAGLLPLRSVVPRSGRGPPRRFTHSSRHSRNSLRLPRPD
ncbi:MAG: hypothetical protein JWM57_2409 [Phycisphaerales bacterium]|nr:hypothetical protein [Phycisphaerales bacterium]